MAWAPLLHLPSSKAVTNTWAMAGHWKCSTGPAAVAADLWPLIGRPPQHTGLWLVQRSWPDLRDIARSVSREARRVKDAGVRSWKYQTFIISKWILEDVEIFLDINFKLFSKPLIPIQQDIRVSEINNSKIATNSKILNSLRSHQSFDLACRYSWPKPHNCDHYSLCINPGDLRWTGRERGAKHGFI